MNQQLNLEISSAPTPISDEMRRQFNVNGVLRYTSTTLLQFYFDRNFLEAFLHAHYQGLFPEISLDQYINRHYNNVLDEPLTFFELYIYNFLADRLPTDLIKSRLTRMRNLFMRLLLVNEYRLLQAIRDILIAQPLATGFYLGVNIDGNQVDYRNPFYLTAWNGQFSIDCF